MTTFDAAIAAAVRRLEDAGVAEPRRDARLLLADLLECDVATVIAWPERCLDAETKAAFEARVARRGAREPVSRILGQREFWSLPFLLSPETLDPRPDSELLVASLLEEVEDRTAPLRLLDLGSGSGCLLLSLLSELPQGRGLGVDASIGAVRTARENAVRLGLAERAEFRLGNWCEGLQGSFDLIVCNPPYIPEAEVPALEAEVSQWEPQRALAGGPDGLESYRVILPELGRLLVPHGVAVFEHGPGQAGEIEGLLPQRDRWLIRRVADLAGHDRCLILAREEGSDKK